LLCGGTTKSAKFDVAGSANQIVKVYVAPTTMNGPGGATLAFTPTNASTSPLTLSNAGAASFAIGGSITVAPTTASSIYSGNTRRSREGLPATAALFRWANRSVPEIS